MGVYWNCEIVLKIYEVLGGKTLRGDINKFINNGDKFNHHILTKNTLTNEVEIHFNIIGASMKNRI